MIIYTIAFYDINFPCPVLKSSTINNEEFIILKLKWQVDYYVKILIKQFQNYNQKQRDLLYK